MTEMVTYRRYNLGEFKRGEAPTPSPSVVKERTYGEWKERIDKAFPNGIPSYLSTTIMTYSNDRVVSRTQPKPNHYRLLLEALTQDDSSSQALQVIVDTVYREILPQKNAPYVHFDEIDGDTCVTTPEDVRLVFQGCKERVLTVQNGYADRGVLRWATLVMETLGKDYKDRNQLPYSAEQISDALTTLYFGPGAAAALNCYDAKRGEFAKAVLIANTSWGHGKECGEVFGMPSQEVVDLAKRIVDTIATQHSEWFWKEEDMQASLFHAPKAVRHIFSKGLLDVLQGESDQKVMEQLKNKLKSFSPKL